MTDNILRILQCNLGKSRQATDSILNHPDSVHFNLLLLQEQHYLIYSKLSLLHHSWSRIEPTAPSELPSSSAIYVNNRIVNNNMLRLYYLPFSDITAVKVLNAYL